MFYKLLNSYVRRVAFTRRGLKYFMKGMQSFGIANKTYQKKLPGDIIMNVNPSEHIQQQLFWYGYYEKPVGNMLKKLLLPGRTFIDVGANIGYFSLLAAQHCPGAKIISLEPVSNSYKALLENIALNKFESIEALNFAAGDKEETSTIYLSADDNTGMSSLQQPENYSGKSEMVKVTRLDQLATDLKLTSVDVVKIDVEGNELAVLKGMKHIMENFKPAILLELNPQTLSRFGVQPADVLDYIKNLSYQPFILSVKKPPVKLDNNIIKDSLDIVLIHSSKAGIINSL